MRLQKPKKRHLLKRKSQSQGEPEEVPPKRTRLQKPKKRHPLKREPPKRARRGAAKKDEAAETKEAAPAEKKEAAIAEKAKTKWRRGAAKRGCRNQRSGTR